MTTSRKAAGQWRRAATVEWLVLTLLLVMLAGTLGEMRGMGRADLTLYDAASLRLGRPAPEDIIVVAIDEESLRAIGRWPWRRAVHATLLDRIAAGKPRGIGVDIILSEPDARDPAGDQALARSLASHPRIVLPVLMEVRPGMAPQPSLPAPVFVSAGVRLGHANVETDPDGIVRSLFLEEGTVSQHWPAFSVALVREELATTGLPGVRNPAGTPDPSAWGRDHWMHIAFSGGPGHVRQVPYVKVLTGEIPASQFAGKYVLVGATATGLGDAYPTPVTGLGRLMPGIEVHAHALDSLLRGRGIEPASPLASAVLSIVPVLAVMLAFLLLSPRVALGFNLAMIVMVLATSMGLLAWARLWFAPSAALLSLVLAYPLWSWRKLEATLRFLGEEFDRLQGEPTIVPESLQLRDNARRNKDADTLERRIESLRTAADSLRHTRRFIADSLEHLPVAVLITGIDERIIIANRHAARCFGASRPEELSGQSAPEIIAQLAKDGRDVWGEARTALSRGESIEMEVSTVAGMSYLLRLGLCVDARGDSVGYLATLADITPIREAERKREETLAFLSHDLRSPQASILAAIDLHKLKPEAFPPESILPRIAAHAHRTVELAEQFVQLMRAESGQLRHAECDLVEAGRQAVEEVRPQAASKSIVLTLAASEPIAVRVDRALLVRAFVNLLNNAVKYSPEKTEVTLAISINANTVRCVVRDQGYGISEADMSRLFERFARFSTPGQPQAKGIGLGLAFVKTVIERHGGHLEVSSTVGKGSEFAFVLERV